jgi:hypothetical protein
MEGMLLEFFLSMLFLVFAVASIIAGFFTAYFGSGKSRAVGAVLIIIGIIVFILFLWFAGFGFMGFMGTAPITFAGIIAEGITAVIGAVVGAAIALGIFLLAIMKA